MCLVLTCSFFSCPRSVPIVTLPNTPEQSPAQRKPENRSRGCHFIAFYVTFCTASYTLSRGKDCLEQVNYLTSGTPHRNLSINMILQEGVPYVSRWPGNPDPLPCTPLGHFFCSKLRNMHHITKSPVPRAQGQGDGRERTKKACWGPDESEVAFAGP